MSWRLGWPIVSENFLRAQREADIIYPFQHTRFSARAACEQTGAISGLGEASPDEYEKVAC